MASKFHIDTEEWLHIGVSVVTISLAFSLFRESVFSPDYFWLIFLTVGLGFVLHELAHKWVAIQYGATAYYRASTFGLFAALALAFLTNGSLVFAAPGAVYFHGHVTREQNGKISLAGPLMNLALAIGFGALAVWAPGLRELALTGVSVNAFLGAFNLVPIGMLDGAKVWAWNKTVWLASFVSMIAVLFFFLSV
ncbi:hypothetical protein HYV43_07165 [Candidatus Micrarchaeota archaeon]|nr:hypothetical protein [Candidatus Micrarchaeota archaeon]